MNRALNVRREAVERVDTVAAMLEQLATDAVDAGDITLAADLWVSSARLLVAADELWEPVSDGTVFAGESASASAPIIPSDD